MGYTSTVAIASVLGVSTNTVRKALALREIPVIRVGNRWRISDEDARSFIETVRKEGELWPSQSGSQK